MVYLDTGDTPSNSLNQREPSQCNPSISAFDSKISGKSPKGFAQLPHRVEASFGLYQTFRLTLLD